MSAMVRVLPSPEKTAEIRELVDRGWSEGDIVEKVWGERTSEHTSAVRAITADMVYHPDAGESLLRQYHPDVDEVAVARALEGDRAVWEGLTHYERREVLMAVYARRMLDEAECRDDRAQIEPLLRVDGYKRPIETVPDWLRLLADSWGLTVKRLIDHARDFSNARVL